MQMNAGIRYDRARMIAAAARARAMTRADPDFLADLGADEIAFRLSATNRQFTSALDLFSTGAQLAVRLGRDRPKMQIESYCFSDWLAGAPPGELFASDRHDFVVSLFGLHRCPDPVAIVTAARATLRPDGLFMAVLPGEGTLAEFGETMMAAEIAERDGAAPRIEPFASLQLAGSWLQQAGFALPVVDVERLTLRYSSLAALIGDLRAMAASNCLRHGRAPFPRAAFGGLEQRYRERFGDADGKLRVSVNLIHLSGWAPHAGQQKPLRPGSASRRLAEMLGKTGK